MDILLTITKKVTAYFKKAFADKPASNLRIGYCLHCNTGVPNADDLFCSQACCVDYWTRYRKSKGGHICGYPGCGRSCFVDASKRVLDFCGRTHAIQFKTLAIEMKRAQTCGYPDCKKPRYVEYNGKRHDFCGHTHAAMYRELQIGVDKAPRADVGNRSAINNQQSTGPIHFYNRDDPYYEFTNFYECTIDLDSRKWRTTEHYFQAQKFVGTPYVELIRQMQRPREAFDLSRNPSVSRWQRSDWENVKCDIMLKALIAKFTQHGDLKAILLGTGTRQLFEHTSNDHFWGDGGDGSGKNNLGKLLMKVRGVLQNQRHVVTSDGDDGEAGGGLASLKTCSGDSADDGDLSLYPSDDTVSSDVDVSPEVDEVMQVESGATASNVENSVDKSKCCTGVTLKPTTGSGAPPLSTPQQQVIPRHDPMTTSHHADDGTSIMDTT